MSMPVRSRIASRQPLAPPRRREVDRPVVAHLRGHVRDQPLAARGDVLVVGVRLVELEHRELRVVGRVHALVAEVLAELVHALEAAHDQPLQVELGGDTQVELAIQRVVVGGERPGQRAPVQGLEHRRLDLDEALGVEEAPDGRDHPSPGDEQLARVLVGDQVELAPAKARLDVGQPVVLLGRGAQGLGQQREVLDAQRQLAPLRYEGDAVDADQVAEVQPQQPLHPLRPKLVDPRLELDPPGAVDEVEERHLALAAPRGQPPRDPVADVGLLTGRQPGMRRAHAGDRLDAVELVGERIDPVGAQRLELAPARREQIVGAVGLVGHGSSLLRLDVDLGDLQPPLALGRGDRRPPRRACGRAAPCRPATRWTAWPRRGWPRRSRRSCIWSTCRRRP